MLRLYDPRTGRLEEIAPARHGTVRVSCTGGLRALLVGDLIRRLLAQHRVRAIGVWDPLPGADDLNVRPAEVSHDDAGERSGDVRIGDSVAPCSFPPVDGLDPLALRLALLSRHYRSEVALRRPELAESDAALTAWRRRVAAWAESPGRPLHAGYVADAISLLDSDLDTPAIFPLLARLSDDPSVPNGAKFETVVQLDLILGLDLVRLVGRV